MLYVDLASVHAHRIKSHVGMSESVAYRSDTCTRMHTCAGAELEATNPMNGVNIYIHVYARTSSVLFEAMNTGKSYLCVCVCVCVCVHT